MAHDPETPVPGTFEYFDHAADLGIRARAATLEGLFVTAGAALLNWIGSPPESAPEREETARLEADDLPELLVRWLQELLYLFQHRRAYCVGVNRMQLGATSLVAQVRCRLWEEENGRGYQEVKAVTYHRLEVTRRGSEWFASVIVDI
jgi:SHS2 domain-containing protein